MRKVLAVIFAVLATTAFAKSASAGRPDAWATRLTRPGLPNFFQVTTNLYRGAQPTVQGLAELKAMNIRTVVNLRTAHPHDPMTAESGLGFAFLRTEPWHVTDEDVVQFLRIAVDKNKQPIFVHCERGADRTGTMCAIYRIACCGWSKPDAIREMTKGGFGFNPTWRNLIHYVQRADIEKLKRRAGLGE